MNGDKRDPMMVWFLIVVTCGLYGLYWYYVMGSDLKSYLADESINPAVDIIILLVCGFYGLYLPIKYGKLIQRAQQKSRHG
ncbi:MAG: DUF4234 domain-containing protein [Myxococcales bacterium]|nr:MAG: DUF4234 domain-containing protein [Myxococcales bacterium]